MEVGRACGLEAAPRRRSRPSIGWSGWTHGTDPESWKLSKTSQVFVERACAELAPARRPSWHAYRRAAGCLVRGTDAARGAGIDSAINFARQDATRHKMRELHVSRTPSDGARSGAALSMCPELGEAEGHRSAPRTHQALLLLTWSAVTFVEIETAGDSGVCSELRRTWPVDGMSDHHVSRALCIKLSGPHTARPRSGRPQMLTDRSSTGQICLIPQQSSRSCCSCCSRCVWRTWRSELPGSAIGYVLLTCCSSGCALKIGRKVCAHVGPMVHRRSHCDERTGVPTVLGVEGWAVSGSHCFGSRSSQPHRAATPATLARHSSGVRK